MKRNENNVMGMEKNVSHVITEQSKLPFAEKEK